MGIAPWSNFAAGAMTAKFEVSHLPARANLKK